MKDELGGKIMKEFVGLRAKTYSYLTEGNHESDKAKSAKNIYNKKKNQGLDQLHGALIDDQC